MGLHKIQLPGVEEMKDIPQDYKIEWDRLIYEMEPQVNRMFEIIKTLPIPSTSAEIEYNGFKVIIEDLA